MIDLQSNYPVLAEQQGNWRALLLQALERFGSPALRLPPFGGWPQDRELVAKWLGVSPARALVAESGHHGLLAAQLAAGLPGKTIAVEALTYPWFVRQAQMLGVRILPVAMNTECIVPDALRVLCKAQRVDAVYTMPSLHNPTGAVAGLARRRQVAEVAREFELRILEDGAYGFLLENEPAHYYELAPERSFDIESLSKRVAPGLRTAFLVTPDTMSADSENGPAGGCEWEFDSAGKPGLCHGGGWAHRRNRGREAVGRSKATGECAGHSGEIGIDRWTEQLAYVGDAAGACRRRRNRGGAMPGARRFDHRRAMVYSAGRRWQFCYRHFPHFPEHLCCGVFG